MTSTVQGVCSCSARELMRIPPCIAQNSVHILTHVWESYVVTGCCKLTPSARAAGLPKTRSGKIMRRILRKIAVKADNELGDVSTLADPSVVQAIIEMRGK